MHQDRKNSNDASWEKQVEKTKRNNEDYKP